MEIYMKTQLDIKWYFISNSLKTRLFRQKLWYSFLKLKSNWRVGHSNRHQCMWIFKTKWDNIIFRYRVPVLNLTNKISSEGLVVQVFYDLALQDHRNKFDKTSHFQRRWSNQSFSCKEVNIQPSLFYLH